MVQSVQISLQFQNTSLFVLRSCTPPPPPPVSFAVAMHTARASSSLISFHPYWPDLLYYRPGPTRRALLHRTAVGLSPSPDMPPSPPPCMLSTAWNWPPTRYEDTVGDNFSRQSALRLDGRVKGGLKDSGTLFEAFRKSSDVWPQSVTTSWPPVSLSRPPISSPNGD